MAGAAQQPNQDAALRFDLTNSPTSSPGTRKRDAHGKLKNHGAAPVLPRPEEGSEPLQPLLTHPSIAKVSAQYGAMEQFLILNKTVCAELWAKPADSGQQGKPRRRAVAVPNQNAENIDDVFVEDLGPLPEQQQQQEVQGMRVMLLLLPPPSTLCTAMHKTPWTFVRHD